MTFQKNRTASGTLTSTTAVLPVPLHGPDYPITVTFKSSAGNRNLELSTDGGNEYFTPIYDVNSATQLALGISAPVTHIRFTGAINDTYSVI